MPLCTYPLTAKAAVDVVITELSVFRVRHGGLVLVELLEGATVDDVRSATTEISQSTWKSARAS